MNRIAQELVKIAKELASEQKRKAGEYQAYRDYVSDIIEEAIDKAGNKLDSDNELYGMSTDEIEHVSRSGFWSSNDGGWEAKGFTTLSSLEGSGYLSSLPGKAQKIGEGQVDYLREGISDGMKENHPDAFEGVRYVGYHEAEKAGLESEYEDMEQGWFNDDTVMFSVGAMYEDADGKGKGENNCYVWVAINFDAPYHRSGKSEWHEDADFTFMGKGDLKAKLRSALSKVMSKM